MKLASYLFLIITVNSLIACGGGGDSGTRNLSPGGVTPTPVPTLEPTPDPDNQGDAPDSEPTPTPVPEPTSVPDEGADQSEVKTSGPHNTGTTQSPLFVYFDLDSGQALTLSEEDAEANDDWDIAFRRTALFLNFRAAEPVAAYFTDNNQDFLDESGAPILDKFLAARDDPDSELSDLTDFDAADLPADEEFSSDEESLAIGGKFYNYDPITHVVSAADNRYFVVQSDGSFSKVRAKDITTAGRTMSDLTLGIAYQGENEIEFSAEQDLPLNMADCEESIYIDLDTFAEVEGLDAWDIRLPCVTVEDVTGADFEINIADDASAFEDSENEVTSIDTSVLNVYGFQENVSLSRFFAEPAWYQYNLQGGHGIWSQFGVYLIKTPTATYKFQIIGYYGPNGESGQYTFRYQVLP